MKEAETGGRCEFWGKWDRKRRNTLIKIGIVNLLMTVIFWIAICEHLKSIKDESEVVLGGKRYDVSRRNKESTGCTLLQNHDCTITCNNINFDNDKDMADLYGDLETAKENYESCFLELQSVRFHNSQLQENWLQLNPTKHANITQLKINRGNLQDITDNAFACLPDLERLTISLTNITSLRKKSFQSMTKLKDLELQENNQLVYAEERFLQNFNLETLQVQNLVLPDSAAAQFFENLTGDSVLKTITSLDWRFNHFGSFPKDILNRIPNLRILALSGSEINEFEVATFQENNIKSLANLFVDANYLKTLPESVFRPVVENVAALYVKSNPLICNCEMEWLQNFIANEKQGNYGDFATVQCFGPPNNKNRPFLEAVMCPCDNGTTTETTTTEMTTSPTDLSTMTTNSPTTLTNPTTTTTDPTDPNLPIDCEPDPSSRHRRSVSKPNIRITLRSEIRLHLPLKTMNFTIDEDDDVVQINLGDTHKSKNLLYWQGPYNTLTQPNVKCRSDIQAAKTSLRIGPDLKPETDYVFCVFDNEEVEINILNCDAHKTQPSYSNRAWLTNKYMPLTSYLLLVAAALFVTIGASVFYFVVRKNPSLIRGSKRVIVVKRHNKAQFMVLPHGYTNSGLNDTDKYIQTYSTVRDSMALSTYGDSSSTASYISALQPTPIEIFTYRMERLQALTMGNEGREEEEICGTPPPLPPYPIRITQHHGRLPPNVDLLFEYEWYTTTTTTTTS